jgi:hypothetical protein
MAADSTTGVRASVTRFRAGDIALLGGQSIGFAVVAVGALAGLPWLSFAGTEIVILDQVVVTLLRSPVNRALSFLGATRAARVLLLVSLTILLYADVSLGQRTGRAAMDASTWAGSAVTIVIILAAALCYVATLADQWLARGNRSGGLAWRGLGSVGLADSIPAPAGIVTAVIALVPAAVLSLGVAGILGGEPAGTYPLGSDPAHLRLLVVGLVSIAASVATCILCIIRRTRATRLGSRETQVAKLQEALRAYAPEVVIFFTAPASGTYALNVWIETANSFTTKTLILSCEGAHLTALEPTDLPVVVAPRTSDIEYLTVDSVRVALHPTTGNKAFRMMRLPGVSQIFIGHGDSDKVSSYNPYTRVFDEIWVSGPAGIDRYRALDEGFRTEQFVTVGRPQLAEIEAVAADGTSVSAAHRPTVLYAPTWEGFLEQSNYSSLATMGPAMVRAMLELPAPPRILFKPHPSSGHRRPDMLAAEQEIIRLLTEAGGDHEVYGPGTVSLYAAFNRADVMITDISSVLTDFLASHKPYLITNPRSEPLADFLLAFPSAAAGSVIDADLGSQNGEGFAAAIERGLGGDPDGRPARIALADYLLGPAQDDPVRAFGDEVARSVERARVRYPGDRVVPLAPREATVVRA